MTISQKVFHCNDRRDEKVDIEHRKKITDFSQQDEDGLNTKISSFENHFLVANKYIKFVCGIVPCVFSTAFRRTYNQNS